MTVPAVAAIGVLLFSFVMVAQFATWIYAGGALRASVQAAARAAAPIDADFGSCAAAFTRTRDQLLGGEVGRSVGPVSCEASDTTVTATVDARFESWFPVMPGWETTVTAVAVREVDPR